MKGITNASSSKNTDMGKYTLNIDQATFSTGANLSYADDAAGLVKLDNSLTTGETPNENIQWGSWQSLEKNPMLRDCFYATIKGDGTILHKLNPYDLSKAIDGTDVSTEITQENVMFVIPTRYLNTTNTSRSVSRNPADGDTLAHTVGGHTYKYLAIGVYPGVNVSGVLKSVAGVKPSASLRRDQFRSYAHANSTGTDGATSNGQWMLWNWHQYSLMRDMAVLFPALDWDSQGQIGNGVQSGSQQANWKNNGSMNSDGLFSGTQQVNHGVKALIENMWSTCWQFVDDVVTGDEYADGDYIWKDLWAGQNAVPVISSDESSSSATINYADKVKVGRIMLGPSSGNIGAGWKYATAIDMSTKGFALPIAQGGSTASYTHDGYYVGAVTVSGGTPTVTNARNFLVGGSSHDGLFAGVASLCLIDVVSYSSWGYGSRLAFVFD